jgi:Glu-tRNA(Gln) amidotransferase subunit E-like FAD-binding protein
MKEFMSTPQNKPQIYKAEDEPIEKARKEHAISKEYAEKYLGTGALSTYTLIEALSKDKFKTLSKEEIESVVDEFQEVDKQRQAVEAEMTPDELVRMFHGQIKAHLSGNFSVEDIRKASAAAKNGLTLIETLPKELQKKFITEKDFFKDTFMWLDAVYPQHLKKEA